MPIRATDRPGIPTTYRGVLYRSRLEAKWAAFFDLLGWPFQYEPFDCYGWIPDFLLLGAKILVEVKPVTTFPADVAAKIDRAGVPDDLEVLIAGCTVPIPDQHGIDSADGLVFGWLRANPPGWQPSLSPTWGRAIAQLFIDDFAHKYGGKPFDGISFYHEHDDSMRCDPDCIPGLLSRDLFAFERIGYGRKLEYWGVNRPDQFNLNNLWAEAGNVTQWRGGR